MQGCRFGFQLAFDRFQVANLGLLTPGFRLLRLQGGSQLFNLHLLLAANAFKVLNMRLLAGGF